MIQIVRLDPDDDFDRVANLLHRAADYVRLETGHTPDDDYTHDALNDAPPHITSDDIHNFGLVRADGSLAGFVGSIRGHYGPQDWYIGLLILDPADRGQGLGARALDYVIALARSMKATVMRIAVLDANAAGRRFWEREGFVLERTVPRDPDGDGHICHILRLELESIDD